MTEEYTKRFEAITVEKQTIEAAVARQKRRPAAAPQSLPPLKASSTKSPKRSTGSLPDRCDQKEAGRHQHPGATDQMEKKRDRGGRAPPAEQGGGHERCLPRAPAFHRPYRGTGEERARLDERNKQIDGEIAGSNDQIAAHKAVIADLEEKQKQFSGEIEELRKKRTDISASIHASETKTDQVRFRQGTVHCPADRARRKGRSPYRGDLQRLLPLWERSRLT